VRHRRLVAAVAAAIALLGTTASAGANGDPPSDVLLAQDAYFPYTPSTSTGVARAVLELTRRTRRDGWPIKVAIVATPNDLGTFTDTIDDPQRYADILAGEIGRPRLLVVMPSGFGTRRLSGEARAALAEMRPIGRGGDPLALQALDAVARIAAVSGHRVPVPEIDRSSAGRRPYRGTVMLHPGAQVLPVPASPAPRRTDEGTSPLLVFGGPVALVIAALVVVTLRERRRHD
jgi:hypothetical protein